MHNTGPPPPYESPQCARPGHSQTVGGVLPASPFMPADTYTTGTTIVTTIVPLGPGSTHTICSYCHAEIDTTTKTEPGMIAYISGVVIALMGCWLGCCLIPCCIDECMDIHHSCPNCKAYLGRYRR
ncbi:cell death-inducing p53-target protein 1 [Bombus pascuorum]|uniref:cell death-inducing p53-target protein 1 n=1 Tax=Bombus pascuorum TaxID=65598 RepID=UPI002128DFC2|nr:cell death-inducing p53-target protein 1 [Bombus pascuorum]XP_060832599.1 cell death-inducing p53-target protein 1 [Bombus pascuorum]XP_060832601.1 cell death-inducing p53-target protein 1 [Bombus pascuorum]